MRHLCESQKTLHLDLGRPGPPVRPVRAAGGQLRAAGLLREADEEEPPAAAASPSGSFVGSGPAGGEVKAAQRSRRTGVQDRVAGPGGCFRRPRGIPGFEDADAYPRQDRLPAGRFVSRQHEAADLRRSNPADEPGQDHGRLQPGLRLHFGILELGASRHGLSAPGLCRTGLSGRPEPAVWAPKAHRPPLRHGGKRIALPRRTAPLSKGSRGHCRLVRCAGRGSAGLPPPGSPSGPDDGHRGRPGAAAPAALPPDIRFFTRRPPGPQHACRGRLAPAAPRTRALRDRPRARRSRCLGSVRVPRQAGHPVQLLLLRREGHPGGGAV
ncbi:hypothetical protein DFJ74DRAFT_682193 [Hyaloraphidium curvatum]|nr:hypothetical protein DFJ74DRAFT_682193 [Hyaloraphidium curvatum]